MLRGRHLRQGDRAPCCVDLGGRPPNGVLIIRTSNLSEMVIQQGCAILTSYKLLDALKQQVLVHIVVLDKALPNPNERIDDQ